MIGYWMAYLVLGTCIVGVLRVQAQLYRATAYRHHRGPTQRAKHARR